MKKSTHVDDDVQAHAEWRTGKENAPEVAEGDRLDMSANITNGIAPYHFLSEIAFRYTRGAARERFPHDSLASEALNTTR